MSHIPVLLQEVVELLQPKPGEFFIDGTLGGGGHTQALIKRLAPGGTMLAIDRDEAAVTHFKAALATQQLRMEQVIILRGNYSQLPHLLAQYSLSRADGLLLDLGISSLQLDASKGAPRNEGDQWEPVGRGFSFRSDEPLLMTFDEEATPVKTLLRTLPEKELARIIWEFSDERYARQIAKSIKGMGKQTPIETTKALTEAVMRAVPSSYEQGRIHPATRTFMALRMYANKEIEHLTKLLDLLPEIMAPGGRVAIISFHSVEDRVVKQAFSHYAKVGAATLINKKPIVPRHQELMQNPRSRSAKLRVLTFSQ